MPGTSETVIATLKEKKELAFAKKGILLALVSGMVWSLDGLTLSKGLAAAPFNDPALWLLAPLLAAGLHDFCAACFTFAWNRRQGRAREVFRALGSKPGRQCILGACFGAPLGMGGYLMAVSLAGPAYTLPITSLYPAIAAVLAVVFLKERISKRAWGGLALCVAGGILISCIPPTGADSAYFYPGIAFACIAAMGWGAEGVCVASAMDFIEPAVALNVYQIVSSCLYACVIVPGALLHLSGVPGCSIGDTLAAVAISADPVFIVAAGLAGAVSYLAWYKAINMTGVSRAMPLNITYSLWGVLFSSLFTNVEITHSLMLGSVVIFTGMFLVIGNPKEMIRLRDVN